MDISVTVCLFLCVCTVTDFSTEDKASGVKFLDGGSLESRAGNLLFLENFAPQKLPQKPVIAYAGVLFVRELDHTRGPCSCQFVQRGRPPTRIFKK